MRERERGKKEVREGEQRKRWAKGKEGRQR